MKSKILKTFMFFVLFSILLVTASFATTDYYTSVKEDVSTYESTTYIIGSTRIDSSMTITAGVAMNAGYNDAKVKVLLNQNIFATKPAMYSYDTDFEEWNLVNEDGTTKLLTSSEVEELEDNLNIFFVNNEEKVLGVPYEGTVDGDSIINPYTGEKETNVKHENNTFYVKALTFEFMFTSNGVNNFVDTNIDTNIQEGKEPTVEKVDIIPSDVAISVGKEFFEVGQLKEAIEKSTPENEVKIWQYIDLDSSVVLEKENMNAVLNLNWNSLNTSNADYVIELKAPNSVLTIKNGSIHGNKYGAIKVDSRDLNGASATLNLEESATIQGFDYGLVIFGSKTTANIAGGVYANNVDGYAISGNGKSGCGGTTLNITGNAYISANQGIGIYIPQDGVTNINGEKVHIYGKTAIAMKAGELNVINGTLEGYGQKIQVPEETNDGTVGTGDAIYVESNEKYEGNVKINISKDANLNSMFGAPIRVYKSSSTDDITITGKYTTAHVDAENNNIICYRADEAAIKVGNTNYAADSLDYALALFATGKEQQAMLLDDITTSEIIQIISETPVNLTLDLNGKKLTTTSDVALNLKSANSSLKIVNNAEPKGIIEGTECSGLGINVIKSQDSISTLEIGKNVEVIGKRYGIELFANNKNDSIAALKVYGTVKATDSYAIAGNGTYNGTEINIYEGANIISENGIALYIPQEGVTNIFGGTITGKTAIGTKAGTLNITGGALYATDSSISNAELVKKGNGIQITGDIIYVECNEGYADHVKINIDVELPVDEDSNVIRVFQPEGAPSIEGVTSEYLTASEPASITTNAGVNATVTTYAVK